MSDGRRFGGCLRPMRSCLGKIFTGDIRVQHYLIDQHGACRHVDRLQTWFKALSENKTVLHEAAAAGDV